VSAYQNTIQQIFDEERTLIAACRLWVASGAGKALLWRPANSRGSAAMLASIDIGERRRVRQSGRWQLLPAGLTAK
jgi:hypothetical protein